ncbi:MAG: ATP-binding protein [Nitrospiraceae bacterium]|nr:ATP-binding protein [Nitrospiraceae bacterium]
MPAHSRGLEGGRSGETDRVQSDTRVGGLITSREQIVPGVLIKHAADRFFTDAGLDAFALVDCREPVGLVTRNKFLMKLFRLYGYELYGKRPVISLADTAPLFIDSEERLDVALDMAMGRPFRNIYDELVVVDSRGHYMGLLSVKELVIRQSHALANSIVQKELANAKAGELEKMDKVKSQFLANVTHELRSPVNAIISLAGLMQAACEKGYIGQTKDRLSLLLSSAASLKAIINNVLDLSKIEAGKMDVIIEEFDAVEELAEIVETTKVLIGGKPVDARLVANAKSLFMESDPVKFRQIVLNLTGNAAKFTERGMITVSVETDGDFIAIAVNDTGPGIKKEDLDKLFTAFGQTEDAKTKRHEGTGLGLTVTRYLVDLLKGNIRVESEWGEGTTFFVRLPGKNPETEGFNERSEGRSEKNNSRD